jgi:RHS repeat-associated protein
MSPGPDLAVAGKAVDELAAPHDVVVESRTGGATLRVALPLSEGRSGFGPDLALVYQSSAPNGPFGLGWSLAGLPAISIATSRGLPRYDGSDQYVSGNGDELVPLLVNDGVGWGWRVDERGDFVVRHFRAAVEGSRERYEQWIEVASGRVHWRSRDSGDVLTIYGEDATGGTRISDSEDERTFSWLPERRYDPNGNAVRLEYLEENSDGVDRAQPYERRSPPTAAGRLPQRYLKRALYGNTVPLAPGGAEPADNRWLFQAVLDYGDHADALTPGPSADRPPTVRLDPFSTFVCGFELRTYRLCRRVLMFHRFAELGAGATLVATAELSYEEDAAGTTLTGVRHTGHRRGGPGAPDIRRSLPPLTFGYSRPSAPGRFEAASATALENVPLGLSGTRHQWADLLGEGLPGILTETPDAWYFKANDGGGSFGAQQAVAARPSTRPGERLVGDFDLDGNTDAAALQGREAGFFAFDRDRERWEGFRALAAIPHHEAAGAHVQMLDLDGDGRAELVISHQDRFTWYPSRGRDGFDAAVEIPKPRSAAAQQAPQIAEDPDFEFRFADMNGDRLLDLVQIRNGRVEYWPQIGRGRFGDAVLMAGSPVFDPRAEPDPARVLLTDLTGSGTADLVYVGNGEMRLWTNASGNRLVEAGTLSSMPYIERLASLRVLDFLGDGTTPCLVWSSSLPGDLVPLRFLRLRGGLPPRLLLSVDNAMGREVRLSYSSSASHYIRDKRSGRGWRTKLPSHVTVVDRHEVIDHVAGTRAIQRFEYHDGRFDGDTHAFLGFSVVDEFDTDERSPGETGTCVRTWFHPGAIPGDAASGAYEGDPRVPRLAPDEIEDMDAFSAEEYAAGMRALAGQVIREEVYEVDASGTHAQHPVQVTQSGYLLRRLQPARNGLPARFDVHLRERLVVHHEQAAEDPRLVHNVVLEVDGFGNVVTEVAIAYPRRGPPAGAPAVQRQLSARASTYRYANVDTADRHELALTVEQRDFDVSGLAAPATGVLAIADVARALRAPLTAPLSHHEEFAAGVQARVTAWSRTLYWDDGRAVALALGTVGKPALLHHEEAACFTGEFVAQVYGGRVDSALLTEAGYVEREGHWWQLGATQRYDEFERFHQLATVERADGATTFGYDPYALTLVEIRDALNNTTRATIDYHVLGPARVSDPNGAIDEVRLDALGVAVVQTTQGQVLDDAGASQSYGHDLVAAHGAALYADPDAVLASPADFVQRAARFIAYDFDGWAAAGRPVREVVVQRAEMVHDGRGGGVAGGALELSVRHLDGFGRDIQTKLRVDAGLAVQRDVAGGVIVDAAGRAVLALADERWLASGHVVHDSRQNPVGAYEPFYTATPAFESDAELQRFGVSTTTAYDALGRIVERSLPNGTQSRTSYEAWRVLRHDPNDTVQDSRYRLEREGLPDPNPEKVALRKAQAHAGTPIVADLDPEGREVREVDSAPGGLQRVTVQRLDSRGHPVAVVDPRGIMAFEQRLDLGGRIVYSRSADAGERWLLPDARDRPVHEWDGRGVHQRRRFDALDRPTSVHAEGPGGLDHRVEELRYGENPAVDRAAVRNALGRLVRHRDEAGVLTIERYDPAGEILRAERQLRARYDAPPHWEDPATVPLEGEGFVSERRFDAFGRVVREALPDGLIRRFERRPGGGIVRVTVASGDGALAETTVLDDVALSARGERTAARLGNGVELTREYDPETFRTRRITATRTGVDARPLLDISYTLDPVGNVVHAVDAVQQPAHATPLLQGLTVSAHQEFTYDAFYRLTASNGRVHQALLEHDYRPGLQHAGGAKGTRHLTLANAAAVERYTQTYRHDLAGNLEQIRHRGGTQSWTTNVWVSDLSNRALPARDPAGTPVANPESRFDATGNCIALAHLRAIEWNRLGKLSRAVLVDRSAAGGLNDAEHYVYGGDGLRVRKVLERDVAGQLEITEKLYLDGCEIKRIRRGGPPLLERTSSFLADDAAQIAVLHRWSADENARETDDIARPRFHYQVENLLRTAVLELDDVGGVIGYEECFPFGGSAFIAGDRLRDVERKDYRYCGKERDDATGLFYFGYRYYAPWIGRWLSPDPIGAEDALNHYQYVQGNPVSLVDPDGLKSVAPAQGRALEIAYRDPTREELLRAFAALPPARQQELLSARDFTYKIDRGALSFVTIDERQAEIARRTAAGETVGVARPRTPAPTENAVAPRGRARVAESRAGSESRGRARAPEPAGPPQERGEPEAGRPADAAKSAPDAKGTGDSKDAASAPDAADGDRPTASPAAEPARVPHTGTDPEGEAAASEAVQPPAADPISATAPPASVEPVPQDDRPPAQATTPPETPPVQSESPAGEVEVQGTSMTSTAVVGGLGLSAAAQGLGATGHGTAERPVAGARGTGTRAGIRGAAGGGGTAATGQKTTALQQLTDIAATFNFVFDRPRGGDPGGIRGSSGLLGWRGPALQIAYIAYTIVNTILMVRSIVMSISWASVRRTAAGLLQAIRNPRAALAAVWGGIRSFRSEIAGAFRWLGRSLNNQTGGVKWYTTIGRLFKDRRAWATIANWRNTQSLWFRSRVVAQNALDYTWEHIIPQSLAKRWPGLRPWLNGYWNTWLRLPRATNSHLGDSLVRKAVFYYGAVVANVRVWRLGTWIGTQALQPQQPQQSQPER